MERDPLGDRMRGYESVRTSASIRRFRSSRASTAAHFTRSRAGWIDLSTPRFTACMLEATLHLMEETNACTGYTQGDEISLAWHVEPGALVHLGDFVDRRPTFDARVWSVPNRAEGANAFLWRELDAIKNSVTMLALAHFSHGELQGVTTNAKWRCCEPRGLAGNSSPRHGSEAATSSVAEPVVPSAPRSWSRFRRSTMCERISTS
jgi:tRNA(His) guanylyltransferase